jgi:hypothetical protein
MDRNIQKCCKCAKWELDFLKLQKKLVFGTPSFEPKKLSEREMELEAQYPGASQELVYFTFEEAQITPIDTQDTKEFIDDFTVQLIFTVTFCTKENVGKYLSEFTLQLYSKMQLWPSMTTEIVDTKWGGINVVCRFAATATRIARIIKQIAKQSKITRTKPKKKTSVKSQDISLFKDNDYGHECSGCDIQENPKLVAGIFGMASIIMGIMFLKKK